MLNLVKDDWIPVIRRGQREIIRPDQITDPAVSRTDWPRADLNLACLELLIGLVYLARPPAGIDDWHDLKDDPPDLAAALAPFAQAFELIDPDGPAFLQDYDMPEAASVPVSYLFLDNSGGAGERKNADLMVRRDRYEALELPLAAMALYALQAFAPAGGRGNRTSMRGGGPLVTLVKPEGAGLWELVWANVPRGRPTDPAHAREALPWLRPTATSDNNRTVPPPSGGGIPVEAFFGMPRRIRLVEEGGCITAFRQRPNGTNYANWTHPLTPYYKQKGSDEWLPRHPRAGQFAWRDWPGVLLDAERADARRASCLRVFWNERAGTLTEAHAIVGGWSMDNAKAVDFLWAEPPIMALDEGAAETAETLVLVASEVAGALKRAIRSVTDTDSGAVSLAAIEEDFWRRTEPGFRDALRALNRAAEEDAATRTRAAASLLRELRSAALAQFDAIALPLLDVAEVAEPGDKARVRTTAQTIIRARRTLLGVFRGKRMKEHLEHFGLTTNLQQEETV
jgi:CRISPR system Cascade subunit CasA